MIFCIISAQGDPSKQVLTFLGWSLFSFTFSNLVIVYSAESVPQP